MKHLFSTAVSVITLLLTSCGGGAGTPEEPVTPPSSNESKVVNFASRATDTGFENGDTVGVYMIYPDASGNGNLLASGNYVDNMKFTCSTGVWTSESPLYWKDETSVADFYAYYPYNANITDATAYRFALTTDQSSLAAYKCNDILWGKQENQSPSVSTVSLVLDHLMCKVNLKVVAGEGFNADELKSSDLSVKIHNVKINSVVNLSTGVVTATGDAVTITPYKQSDLNYSVYMAPQSIAQCDMIEILYNGSTYKLNRAFSCESGKSYTCTLTMTKNKGGINIGIGAWDVVDGDFGGIVN